MTDKETTRDGASPPRANDADSAVFAVFSEQTVNEALVRNEELRTENSSLQAARDLLLNVRVLKDGENFWTGSLLDCEEEDGQDDHDFFVLNVGVEPFPLDEVKQLSCIVSGFPVISGIFDRRMWGANNFSTMKGDHTVELKLKLGSCVLVGSLENYPGTIEYVRQMVVDNRLLMHMQTFGALSHPDMTPVTDGRDDAVEGSTFRLSKIKVAKSAVQIILDQENEAATKAANDCQVLDLQALAKADNVNRTLRTVLETRTGLLQENILLKSARDTVKTVQVRHPGGSFCCDLSGGKSAPIVEEERDSPAWLVEIPPGEGKVSLLEVGGMRISLAGFPLSPSYPHTQGAQLAPDGRIMLVPYNHMVDACFVFDEGWRDVELESVLGGHHIVDWLRVQLCGGSNDQVTFSIPTYNGPKLSVRLIFLHFRMGLVSQCLDALNIDVSAAEGEAPEE